MEHHVAVGETLAVHGDGVGLAVVYNGLGLGSDGQIYHAVLNGVCAVGADGVDNGDELILGNARSSGLGKCEILSKDFVSYEDTPFAVNAPSHALENKCYMMLYSHTVMRDETGEYAGLHLKALEKKLGVSELRIEYCATSTKSIHGYNRKLGVKIPSVPMYEQGSVFQFSYQGLLTPERMREVMESGIGVRRNEGFGQVVFLKDYEQIIWKLEGRRQD